MNKKRPNNYSLKYLNDTDAKFLLHWEREDYQKMLEIKFPEYDFNLLNDAYLMNIYDSADHEQKETLDEYYE